MNLWPQKNERSAKGSLRTDVVESDFTQDRDRVRNDLLRFSRFFVAILTKALADPTSPRRHAAAIALGKTGDPRAVKPLEIALRDEDSHVRVAAVDDTRCAHPIRSRPALGLDARSEQIPGLSIDSVRFKIGRISRDS